MVAALRPAFSRSWREAEQVGAPSSADVGDPQTVGTEAVLADRHAFDLPGALTPQLGSAEVEPAPAAVHDDHCSGVSHAADLHSRCRDRQVDVTVPVEVAGGDLATNLSADRIWPGTPGVS